MTLFQRVIKKEEPEIEWVCWQDGIHRSFEPMQKADTRPYSPPSRGRARLTRLGSVALLGVALHFSGATEFLADQISHQQGSQYAPITSPHPVARP